MRYFVTFLCFVLLGGCGDSKFANLSDSDLQDRFTECRNAKRLSPGGAITCDNIQRECDRRAKQKGHNLCY